MLNNSLISSVFSGKKIMILDKTSSLYLNSSLVAVKSPKSICLYGLLGSDSLYSKATLVSPKTGSPLNKNSLILKSELDFRFSRFNSISSPSLFNNCPDWLTLIS